jgi:hypothetical protein
MHPTSTCAPYRPLLLTSTVAHALLTLAAAGLIIVPCCGVTGRFEGLPTRERRVLACEASGIAGVGVAVGLVRVLVVLGWMGIHSGYEIWGGITVAGTGGFFVVTVVELDVLLCCACAPALRVVVARLWAMMRGKPKGLGSGEGEEDESVDLTSVVSYHGYPWTRTATPITATPNARSRNTSVLDVGSFQRQGLVLPPVPVPPPPVAIALRSTPTTLSLRSFMGSLAPRSRGRMEGDDRAGLLGDGNQLDADEAPSRRRSSAEFEAYYEKFGGYDGSEKVQSRGTADAEARRSRGSRGYSLAWGDSQESFVLGLNDPNSPTRLSPVAGVSETVGAELTRPEEIKEKEADGTFNPFSMGGPFTP